MRIPRILLADDDCAFRLTTAELLREDGYEVVPVEDGRQVVRELSRLPFDLVLLDLRMPGSDGLGVVELVRRLGHGVPILMISGFGTVDATVRALHLGADDFLTKPVEPELLSLRVAELLEHRPSTVAARDAAYAGMVGRCAPMLKVFDDVRRVARTLSTVLVTGETGSGKELVARAIHEASGRPGLFVAISCVSLSEGLLESELFGHVRGAFTGAVYEKPGLFEMATGGTLFLDEVGEISPALQQRLLRALQEREIRRVGAVRTTRVDVRVVAATGRDLREEVAAGRFRADLFYRLNVFPITVPPLRERGGDIPLLAHAALQRLPGRASDASGSCFSPLAMRMLRAHAWPGNVRELFAVVESAAIRSEAGRIEPQHLPADVRAAVHPQAAGGRYRAPAPGEGELPVILAALEEADGSRAGAAEILGMSRTTLWRKLKSRGLDPAI